MCLEQLMNCKRVSWESRRWTGGLVQQQWNSDHPKSTLVSCWDLRR